LLREQINKLALRIHARDVVVVYIPAVLYAEGFIEARHELGREHVVGIAKARYTPALLYIIWHASDEKLALEIRVIPREDELLLGAHGGVAVLEIEREIFISVVQIAPRLVCFLLALIRCGFEKLIGFIITHESYRVFKKARCNGLFYLYYPIGRAS